MHFPARLMTKEVDEALVLARRHSMAELQEALALAQKFERLNIRSAFLGALLIIFGIATLMGNRYALLGASLLLLAAGLLALKGEKVQAVPERADTIRLAIRLKENAPLIRAKFEGLEQ